MNMEKSTRELLDDKIGEEICFYLSNGVKLFATYFGMTEDGDIIASTKENGGRQIIMQNALATITIKQFADEGK